MRHLKKTTLLLNWLDQRTVAQSRGILFLAGALTAFSFAPFYLFPLLAISYPVLLLLLFKSKRLFDAMTFGWWFGFGQLFTGTIWIVSAFEVDGRYWGGLGYFAVAGLAGVLALYPGLAMGLLWRIFQHKDPKKYALSIAIFFVVFWNLAEWLRGHMFTGFPWNLSGYIWGFSDVMLQTTAIWGIYSLGLFTIFLALVPYIMLQRRENKAACYGVALAALVMITGMFSYGMVHLSGPTKFRHDVTFKIVQANINQKDKWDPAKKADNFVQHLNMSKSRPEEGITHVIWPETAVIYFLDTEPSRRYLIADMLNENEVLMTGFPRIERRPDFKAWNSFAVIGKDGNVQNIYDKSHLVPFGEYTPDILSDSLSFLGLGMLVEGFSYSRGEGIKTMHNATTPAFGVLICYEIIFPGAVVDQNNRPDWLLNVTNDAWYGRFSEPYQHLVQTRVRAIEEGLPIIRSAGTGISAVIDPFGRIIKSIALNEQGVIVSPLPAKRENSTFYSQNSSWIFFALVLFCASFILIFQRH